MMSGFPLGSEDRPLRVAVVGSGPSGFYAIAALFMTKGLHVEVDLFDRLPTPFGLVRGGVAPDHQEIKNVIRIYDKTAKRPSFRFFGGVKLGEDIQLDDLVKHYDQIVLATGNESDRGMGIPGESLAGVYSATEFVGWYNAHPDFRDRSFGLAEANRVAVIGNGNVAMDVVRVLARDVNELAVTDIADHAVAELRKSRVTHLQLWGRRGPAQAAFSPKEIREVGGLSAADLVIAPEEMELSELSSTWLAEKADRDAKKNVAYLAEKAAAGESSKPRKIVCKFLVSPREFIGEGGRLTGVRLEKNELFEDERGTPRPRGTGETWVEPVDLVFKAIGYRGVAIPGVPFHERWGIFHNEEGRLVDGETREPVPNQYVVGWAKRGPIGRIGTNAPDSKATVKRMLEDIEGRTAAIDPDKARTAIVALLRGRGINFVTYDDWNRLDAEEVARGKAAGKLREKFADVNEMMAVIRRLRAS